VAALAVTALTTALTTAGLGLTASPAAAERPVHEPTVESTPLVKGLYQTAYSQRNDLVWTASAVGRPPVRESALTAVDPDTLEVVLQVTPPVADPETGSLQAVYGVAVDDEHNTVWTTNTRNDSVSVYSQVDGSLLATFDDVTHARELAVDEKRDLAWATAVNTGEVVGFDTETLEEVARIDLTERFAGARATGLALDEATGSLYVADLQNNQLVSIVKPASDHPRIRAYATGAGTIGAAVSKNGRYAYTANQTDGTLSAVDLRRGTVRTVDTGAGALSVEDDPRTGDLWVANRTEATVTVLDDRTLTQLAEIPTATNPNHVAFGGGSAWVVDKANDGPNEESNLYKITR